MLAESEQVFLRRLGYSPEAVFDARRMRAAHWKDAVRETNKVIVLGKPCRAAGHRLRTRSGHCVQCDTSKLGFQNRYNSPGYVYVARSSTSGLVKIGTAQNIKIREQKLRYEQHAQADDWRILYAVKVKTGAKIEHKIFSTLARYRTSRSYVKEGKINEANELFKCSVATAIETLRSLISPSDTLGEPWISMRLITYVERGFVTKLRQHDSRHDSAE